MQVWQSRRTRLVGIAVVVVVVVVVVVEAVEALMGFDTSLEMSAAICFAV